MPYRYRNISFPRALVDHLEQIVREHPELGYRSHTEAAIEAVRLLIADIESQLAGKQGGGDRADADKTLDDVLSLIQKYARQQRRARPTDKTPERRG